MHCIINFQLIVFSKSTNINFVTKLLLHPVGLNEDSKSIITVLAFMI